jgi:hypothetical protein
VETGKEAKVCSRCKEAKPPGAFGAERRGRSGLRSECKACVTARHNERYRADAGHRAAILVRNREYKASPLGSLVSARSEVVCRLRGAVKESTRERQRRRIAELDRQIAELRAGRQDAA